MPEEELIEEEEEIIVDPLKEFVKGLLGFYGSGGDSVLAPLILAAQQTLILAGVNPPLEEGEEGTLDEKAISLYHTAVALQVKILSDGDDKGAFRQSLTAIILQLKEFGGEDE